MKRKIVKLLSSPIFEDNLIGLSLIGGNTWEDFLEMGIGRKMRNGFRYSFKRRCHDANRVIFHRINPETVAYLGDFSIIFMSMEDYTGAYPHIQLIDI